MRVSLFALALLCSGCAGTQVSKDLLETARATTPGSEFHIEFDADGRLVKAGGPVELDTVPAACRAAADEAFPGGRQTRAERLVVGDSRMWLVVKEIDGRVLELIVEDDGTVAGGEEVLARGSWPASIVEAGQAAVPGAHLERVERVWGAEARGGEAYHLKFVDRGESVRVGLSADGEVVTVVRRMTGQVRIPR